MKQIFTTLAFTFRNAVKKKAFIVSTVIITVLIIAIFAIVSLVIANADDSGSDSSFDSNVSVVIPDEEKTHTCYYIDEQKLIPTGLKELQKSMPYVKVIEGTSASIEEYRDEVASSSDYFIASIVNGQNNVPSIDFVYKDFMNTDYQSTVVDTLTNAWVTGKLAESGINNDMIALSQTTLQYTLDSAGEMNISGYILGILLLLLMFFAVYYYGYGVSMSVATEKTSRVMETLVVSAKPRYILLGKCLAMGLVGLAQFVYILLLALGCFKIFLPSDVLGTDISLSSLSAGNIILIVVYFLLGYALYAMLNSVSGASVSKIEDLQSAMMPVMLISLISFYLGYMTAIISPEGTLAKIAQYLPFSSAFIMPFKLLNGGVSATDLLISISLLVLSIIIITAFSIKLYEASVLHYGNKLKLKDMRKMIK